MTSARMINIGTAKGDDAFVVQRFSGREELGRLFEYRVELLSEQGDIAPNDLLGTNATVGVELPAGDSTRYYNGYISRFVVLGQVRTPAFKSGIGFAYQATLSPWLWFLTRTSTCAIFQQKAIAEILDEVLSRRAAIKSVSVRLNGDTEKRDYCVQYRETDFNFFSRLMEQAGLYYHFEHENGKHTLVLMNQTGSHTPTPGLAEVRYAGEKKGDATLTAWEMSAEVQPGAYAVGDFDYNKPNTALGKVASNEKPHKNAGFELFDYPGEYTEPAWGEKYANYALEELQTRHEVSRGSGVERAVQVGFKLKLADHPVASQNKEYLVTAHSFEADNNLADASGGAGATFSCSFSVIPAVTQFRPARLTPRPSIAGPQTAIVVGPKGEEIHTDELGRIKVQFHWDRYSTGSDQDSCWLRVSNPLAGKGWGAIDIPRVGQEVIVQFLEGDPDRPIVTGRVYNGANQTPYEMPSKKAINGLKTRSYPNGGNDEFNELRFDDTKGSEQIYLQAQKFLDFRVKNHYKTYVGGATSTYSADSIFTKTDADKHLTTKGDLHVTAVEGLMGIKAKQEILAQSDSNIGFQAKDQLSGKAKNIAFTADSSIQSKASDIFESASGSVQIKAGKIYLTADSELHLKVGGSLVVLDAAGVTIVGTMVKINSGGSASAANAAQPVPAMDIPDAKLPAIAMNSAGGEKSEPPKAREKPKVYGGQATAFKVAARGGVPFVETCDDC